VNCRDIDGLVISYASGETTSPEAAAHIAGCERCRRLVQAIGLTSPLSQPSPEQLKRIESGLLADLTPVKPLPARGVLCFELLFILLVVVAIGNALLGTSGWHALSLLQRIAVFTALAAAAGLLAFSASRQIVPGSRFRLSPYVLVVAVFGVITGGCSILFLPQSEAQFISTGLVCLKIGLEVAIPAAALLWLLLRRGAILNPVLTGATAGALAGLSGLTVLEIFCPNLNEYHILVWHLGAVFTSITGGVAIGLIAEYSGSRRVRRT